MLVAAVLWPFVGAPLVNDYRLWRAERSFDSIQHPVGTKLVKRAKEVGLLIGNSNHCDYFVGELRSYSGSQSRIRAAYAGKRVWDPIPGNGELRVVFYVNGEPTDDKFEIPYRIWSLEEWGLKKSDSRKLYGVYFLSGGQDPGLDLRCH